MKSKCQEHAVLQIDLQFLDKRECIGIEPTESFVQTLHWF